MTARDVITEYLAAARAGNWDTAYDYFADDIVFHIPGRSSFAGDRRGKEAAIDYIQSIRDHHRDGEIQVELIDMLTSEERVALLVRERFLGKGEPVEIRRANVYRVEDEKIVEISIFEADQYAADALMDEVESS